MILVLGLAATFQLWQTVRRAQDAELEAHTTAVARLLAQVIEAQIDGQELSALQRWADQSERQGDGTANWQSNAERFLADHPSFSAVARIDDRGRARDSAGESEARSRLRALVPETLALTSRHRDGTGLADAAIGPIRFADGRAAFGVPISVRSSGKAPSVVLALLEPAVALQRILERGAAGYSIRVLCRSEEIFSTAPAGSEPRADRFWKAEDVALGIGPPWTVAVHPTDLLLVGPHRSSAVLALGGGLTITALLTLLVHLSQVARARAVSLVRVDADLVESIGETEREETEIRELRGELETRVTERTSTLQDTIDELETFNYSVAHDLRSPMGAVINFAGILEHDHGGELDAEAREYLHRISASATTAVALMNGLLAFSHSGREELHKRDVDTRDLVEGVRDDLGAASAASAASAAKINIGELPRAYADPSMMRRVFTNLISNALKFTRPGESARVDIAGYAQGDEIVYFVRDQGVGFDMRHAKKLFGVFERLHSSQQFEGNGIGLAIVSRLVRRHGGRTWAQGVVGQGATFFFSLPTRGSTGVGADGTPTV